MKYSIFSLKTVKFISLIKRFGKEIIFLLISLTRSLPTWSWLMVHDGGYVSTNLAIITHDCDWYLKTTNERKTRKIIIILINQVLEYFLLFMWNLFLSYTEEICKLLAFFSQDGLTCQANIKCFFFRKKDSSFWPRLTHILKWHSFFCFL